MTLSKEQIKTAKTFCKENGLNVKLINKEIGNGFWMEECGGTFQGYLNHLKNDKRDGSTLHELLKEALRKSPVQRMYREVK